MLGVAVGFCSNLVLVLVLILDLILHSIKDLELASLNFLLVTWDVMWRLESLMQPGVRVEAA